MQQLCSSADVLSLCPPGEPCEEETSEVNIELLWEITNCRNSSKVFFFQMLNEESDVVTLVCEPSTETDRKSMDSK